MISNSSPRANFIKVPEFRNRVRGKHERFFVRPLVVFGFCLLLHIGLNFYVFVALESEFADFLYSVLQYGLGLCLILYLSAVLQKKRDTFFANAGALFLLANSVYFSISSMKYHTRPRYEDYLNSSDLRFLGTLFCFIAIWLAIWAIGRFRLNRKRLFYELQEQSVRSGIFVALLGCFLLGRLPGYAGMSESYGGLLLGIVSSYAFFGLWMWVGYMLVSGWGFGRRITYWIFLLLAFMTFDRLLDSGARYIVFSAGLAFFSGLSIGWLRTGIAMICYLTAGLQLGSVFFMERVTAFLKGFRGSLIGTLENNLTMLSYRSNLSDLGLNLLDGSKFFAVRWDLIQETFVSVLPRALKPSDFSYRVYKMRLVYEEAGLYASDYPDTVFSTGIMMFGFLGGLFSFLFIVLLLQWVQRFLLGVSFAKTVLAGSVFVLAGAGLVIELSSQQIGIKLRNAFFAVVVFSTVYSVVLPFFAGRKRSFTRRTRRNFILGKTGLGSFR